MLRSASEADTHILSTCVGEHLHGEHAQCRPVKPCQLYGTSFPSSGNAECPPSHDDDNQAETLSLDPLVNETVP